MTSIKQVLFLTETLSESINYVAKGSIWNESNAKSWLVVYSGSSIVPIKFHCFHCVPLRSRSRVHPEDFCSCTKETPGYFADYGGSFQVSEASGTSTMRAESAQKDLCIIGQIGYDRDTSLLVAYLLALVQASNVHVFGPAIRFGVKVVINKYTFTTYDYIYIYLTIYIYLHTHTSILLLASGVQPKTQNTNPRRSNSSPASSHGQRLGNVICTKTASF